ncbi:MAG TPA: hypothetical protein P5277_04390 [Candidatus Paceibacterota bacterium]|nr:hypothetical protein [Candidatus Paceibacterota bacterium]
MRNIKTIIRTYPNGKSIVVSQDLSWKSQYLSLISGLRSRNRDFFTATELMYLTGDKRPVVVSRLNTLVKNKWIKPFVTNKCKIFDRTVYVRNQEKFNKFIDKYQSFCSDCSPFMNKNQS